MAKLALGFLSAIQLISGWPSQPYILLWVCELSQWSDPNNKPSTVCYSWFTTPRGCWWNILSRPETRASGSAVGFLGFTGQVTATVTRIAKPSPESHCFRRQSQIHSTHIRAHLNFEPPKMTGSQEMVCFPGGQSSRVGPGAFQKLGRRSQKLWSAGGLASWHRGETQWFTYEKQPFSMAVYYVKFQGMPVVAMIFLSVNCQQHWYQRSEDCIEIPMIQLQHDNFQKQNKHVSWCEKNPAKNHNHGKGHHHHQPLYKSSSSSTMKNHQQPPSSSSSS